jgi:hypothetical protein
MKKIIEKLAGTWFIIGSDFPMWLKGDKQSPSFTYTLQEKKGKQILYDEVSFYQNKKRRSIKGFDTPENENSFMWRGKGLLFFVRSKWSVRLFNETEGWAVICFSKTIFTPEGVDIISKNKTIGPIMLDKIRAEMREDPFLKDHVKKIVLLK